MAVFHAADMADLIKGTLRELGPPKFQQIAQTWEHLEVLPIWFKKDRVVFDTGYGIQRNLMTKLSTSAGHVGLFDTDSADIPDLMAQMTVDWVHAKTSWAMEYRSDVLMNRGRSLVFDVIKPRRTAALINLAEEMERKAFAAPASSTTNDPYGLPYWIVTNATTGFNGGAPTGHTTVAGVNLTTHPTFKNYTAQYTTVTKDDLITKMKTGLESIRWKSPVGSVDYNSDQGKKYRLYCKQATLRSFEDLIEGQNDALGSDTAPAGPSRDFKEVDFTLTFRKHPIVYIPFLGDSAFTAANNPIYMIDHSTFYPCVLKGDYLRETPPRESPSQVNVYRMFIFLSYQYLCVDRRRNAVFDTA